MTAGLLFHAGPVSAGSEEDPEISLDCQAEPPYYTNYLDSAAVCAVWFEADVDDGLTELRTVVRFAGDPRERPPSFAFLVRWKVGDCYQAWKVSDVRAGLREPEYRVIWRCGGGEEQRVAAPLDGAVEFSADRLTVRWRPEALPEPVADRLAVGVTLTEIVFSELLRVDPGLDEVTGGPVAVETNYTTTYADQSRPYTIGS